MQMQGNAHVGAFNNNDDPEIAAAIAASLGAPANGGDDGDLQAVLALSLQDFWPYYLLN